MSGVRIEAGKVIITPFSGYLKDFSGTICIPGGTAKFTYTDQVYTITLSTGTEATLYDPDGNHQKLTGAHTYSVQIN